MSLLNDASLILVPSAIKTGEVLVQKPLPNKFADETGNYDGNDPQGSANLTFTRASSATRVGPDGLIEKVRTNLLTQSEEFTTSNGWFAGVTGGSTATQTSNYGIAPNGTTTADRIQLALNGEPYADWVRPVSGFVIGQSYTYSIYLKSLTGSTNLEFFNDGASNVLKTITTEWVRYSHSFTASSATIYPRFLLGVTTSSTADLLAWGYQLETGDIATDYIATTTAAVSVGPVSGLPRLDYLGSSCGKLLLEPQRQNLVTFSEQMDNAAWNKNLVSVTANQTTSPDGYTNADLIDALTGTGQHFISAASIGYTNAVPYTFSVFAKKGNTSLIQLFGASGVFGVNVWASYNFDTLEVTTGSAATASMVDYGSGWYRLILTGTVTVASTVASFYAAFTNDKSVRLPSFTAANQTVYLFGAQTEQASYATSYIPTLGAAVTRLADACSKTGISSLIGQTQGTLFVEFVSGADDATNHIVSLSDGTTSNRVSLVKNTSDDLRAFVSSGGASQASILWSNYAPNTNIKAAISYKANEIVFYANGESAGTDISALVPASLTQIEFETSSSPFAYPVKQLIIFPTALSATDLAALTA